MENRIARITGVIIDLAIESPDEITVGHIEFVLKEDYNFEEEDLPDRTTIYRILKELEDLDLIKRYEEGSSKWYRGDRFYNLKGN